MTDEACELNHCIKRFYRFVRLPTDPPSAAPHLEGKLTVTSGDTEITPLSAEELLKATAIAVAALTQREKEGKMLKTCPAGCDCTAPDAAPAASIWSQPVTSAYSVATGADKIRRPQVGEWVVHFKALQEHTDVTAGCQPHEERLAFADPTPAPALTLTQVGEQMRRLADALETHRGGGATG